MSADPADLPFEATAGKKTTFRSVTVDVGKWSSQKASQNCTRGSMKEILARQGFGMYDGRPSIELARQVRDVPLTAR